MNIIIHTQCKHQLIFIVHRQKDNHKKFLLVSREFTHELAGQTSPVPCPSWGARGGPRWTGTGGPSPGRHRLPHPRGIMPLIPSLRLHGRVVSLSLIHYNIGPSTANLWSKLIVSIVLRGNSNVGLYDNKIRACWWTRGEHISRPTVFINLLSFTRRNAKAYLTLGSKQTFPRQMVALRVTFRA